MNDSLLPRPALSLAHKLALVFALVALFAAGLTGYLAYRDARQALVSTAKEQLNTATRMLGRRIALTLNSVERDLVLIAQHPDSIRALGGDSASGERAADLFARMIGNRHAYFQIRLIAADDGMERVRADRSPSGPLIVHGAELQAKAHFPYVYETLALPRNGLYLSPASINHEQGAHDAEHQPSIQLAMPVHAPFDGPRTTPGKTLGVAVINLDLNGLFRLLAIDLPAGTALYLANRAGDFLIHPEAQHAFAFDRGRRSLVQDEFPQVQPLLTRERNEITSLHEGTGKGDRAAGGTKATGSVCSFIHVEALPGAWLAAGGERGLQLILGLSQPLTAIHQRSGGLAGNAMINALAAGLIAVLLSFYIARKATASLRQIERAMTRFGLPGATELPTGRHDEIGALARRFAAMQAQINKQLLTLEAQHQALDHEAQHDWLTGLANRRNLMAFLPQALARSIRRADSLALFFIDLDNFKPINDTHGHDTGDQVLIEVARRLKNGVRTGDYIARPGGDEFVVVCEGVDVPAEAVRIAEKLIRMISEPIAIGHLNLQVGASIGIASYPLDGNDAGTLTCAADRAMYEAKTAGRGTWQLASRRAALAPPADGMAADQPDTGTGNRQ